MGKRGHDKFGLASERRERKRRPVWRAAPSITQIILYPRPLIVHAMPRSTRRDPQNRKENRWTHPLRRDLYSPEDLSGLSKTKL